MSSNETGYYEFEIYQSQILYFPKLNMIDQFIMFILEASRRLIYIVFSINISTLSLPLSLSLALLILGGLYNQRMQ